MNERFKELAEQARKKPLGNSWTYRLSGEFEQKFAELIVQDCVGIVRNQGPFLRYNAIAEAIQKHFGIKK